MLAALLLGLAMALAGCALAEPPGAFPTYTGTPTPITFPTFTSPTPLSQRAQPTPLPVGSFTIYANTTYGYTLSYPRNWSVEGATAVAQSFFVFNYDPQTYRRPAPVFTQMLASLAMSG